MDLWEPVNPLFPVGYRLGGSLSLFTHNRPVVGSSPTWPTSLFNGLRVSAFPPKKGIKGIKTCIFRLKKGGDKVSNIGGGFIKESSEVG